MKKLKPGEVLASLATSKWWNRFSLILKVKNLMPWYFWKGSKPVGGCISSVFDASMFILPSHICFFFVVPSQVDSFRTATINEPFIQSYEENRVSVLPELFNLMSGPEGRTWVLGFHQVRSPLELMAQDLELELNIMYTPIYLFIVFHSI